MKSMVNAAGARLALVAAVLFAASCGMGLREPEIRLDSVRLGNLGLQGGTLVVALEVENPNRFAIQAGTLSYAVELLDEDGSAAEPRWVHLASGTFEDGMRVEPRTASRVEIPVQFRYRDAGAAVRSILMHGTFDYRLSGSVQVEKPVRRQLPYRHIGTVSIVAGE